MLRERGLVFHPTTSRDHLARFIVRNAAGRRVFDGSEPEIEAWLRGAKPRKSFKVRVRLARAFAKDMVVDKPGVLAEEILEGLCDMGWASSAAEATELLDGERYMPAEQVKAKRRAGRERGKQGGRTYK